MKTVRLFLIMLLLSGSKPAVAQMVAIPAGSYVPLYAVAAAPVKVHAFNIDPYAVTRLQYAAFVRANPQWRRSRVHATGYLSDWPSDTVFGDASDAQRPVTRVTRVAAQAYCSARGARLPTADEWEYAAAASPTMRDGSKDRSFKQLLLDLYTRPRAARVPVVGSGFRNAYGVNDMHGMIWEWVQEDAPMNMPGMKAGVHDLTCAGSSNGASDPANFGAFLRHAYRSGLTSTSTGSSLGFRCATGG